jgi:hypothetical protein
MSLKNNKKKDASRVREVLLEELGENEFNRVFEETKRELNVEYGPWPPVSSEDVVLTMGHRLRKPAGKKYDKLEDFDVTVSHDGEHWRVYYYPVDFFREELPIFGKFLELLKERGEEVSTIIPNTGWVRTSIILGSSFQGVKGFAVITRRPKSS